MGNWHCSVSSTHTLSRLLLLQWTGRVSGARDTSGLGSDDLSSGSREKTLICSRSSNPLLTPSSPYRPGPRTTRELPLWPSDPGQSRLLNKQLRAPSLPRQAVSLSLVSEEEEACLPELPLQVTGVQEPRPHEGRAKWAKTKTRWWSLHRGPEDLTTGTCSPSQGKQSVICSGNHISLCQTPKPTPGLPVSRRCRVQGLPVLWGLSCVLPPSREEASCLGAPFKTSWLPTTSRGNLKPRQAHPPAHGHMHH